MLPLHWWQVDFKASIICLEPGTTKNDDGRILVMTPELRATLERRGRQGEPTAEERPDYPLRLSPQRQADQGLQQSVAPRLPEGWTLWPHP